MKILAEVDLQEYGTQYGVWADGHVVPSLATTERARAVDLAHALSIGGTARVVTRILYASAWTDCPAGGETP